MPKTVDVSQKWPFMTNSRHDYDRTCDRDFILSMSYVWFGIFSYGSHVTPSEKQKAVYPPVEIGFLAFR